MPGETGGAPPLRRLRILFFVHNTGKTRHFDGVLDRLASRGHRVVLAVAAKPSAKLGGRKDKRIEVVACPVRRVDRWKIAAPTLRLVGDYLRFFEPAHAGTTKLTERAATQVPGVWRERIDSHPWIRRHAASVGRLLTLAETALPPEKYFELFIRYHEPDLVVVTPLVDFGSYQTDYVKAAHRLGIPVAFVPFSWDNLTNRGLIRVIPDRVLVWNDIQKREAVDLHRVPERSVVVTGAARFDDFFDLEPSTTREDFCAGVGLDPSRRLLLYVCSSPFVAPQEVEFVRRWILEVRKSTNPDVAAAAVLIRPHPVHTGQWDHVSFDDLPQVAIWRKPSGMNSDQGLFDSLHHASALVGLNTSAMLEASIVGRPVLTVLAPDFTGGQDETLHFRYLRRDNGGPVTVAANFDEHRTQLDVVFRDPVKAEKRASRFMRSFIRPVGRHHRVDRIVVEELERAAAIEKHPRLAAPWHYPVRLAMRMVLGAQ